MPYTNRPSDQPRVIGLTMVKNEQDIIEPMLRHNAGLLDALIVLDNASVDDTRGIALSVARELGNIVVTDSTEFGYTQGERMTRLLNAAQSSYFADFIMFIDADEFIGMANRGALHAELSKIPPNGFGAVSWRNFVLNDGGTVVDPPHGLTHRLSEEALPTMKSVLRLDGAFRSDLVVGRGNHAIYCSGEPLPGVLLPDLPLWHFPIRGHAQLTAKALIGWLACLTADPNAAEARQSYHWRGMFRRITDGPGFDGSELRTLSLHYTDSSYVQGRPQPPDPAVVHDPAPIEYARRYSTGEYLDPLILVARSWEQSLRPHDKLFVRGECEGITIDIPPFRFLVEKYQPASVLDIGCETGVELELFARLGVHELTGVGMLPRGGLMRRQDCYIRHDPAVPFTLSRTYALVLCLNTAADQSPSDPLTLIANADRHAEAMIMFSLDAPTVASMGEWLAAWRQFDWIPDLRETLALRCLASCAELRRGLIILCRSTAVARIDGTAELLVNLGRPFRQPAPSSVVHEEPLSDAAVASWEGYGA